MVVIVSTLEVKVLVRVGLRKAVADRRLERWVWSLYIKPSALDCNLHVAWGLC